MTIYLETIKEFNKTHETKLQDHINIWLGNIVAEEATEDSLWLQ